MKMCSLFYMTGGTLIRKFIMVLQSCTVPLQDVQHSCSETNATCFDACDAINIKREEGTDIDNRGEEIPVPISFPTIKCEEDEVSFMCVCVFINIRCILPISRNECPVSSSSSVCLPVHIKNSTVVD